MNRPKYGANRCNLCDWRIIIKLNLLCQLWINKSIHEAPSFTFRSLSPSSRNHFLMMDSCGNYFYHFLYDVDEWKIKLYTTNLLRARLQWIDCNSWWHNIKSKNNIKTTILKTCQAKASVKTRKRALYRFHLYPRFDWDEFFPKYICKLDDKKVKSAELEIIIKSITMWVALPIRDTFGLKLQKYCLFIQ